MPGIIKKQEQQEVVWNVSHLTLEKIKTRISNVQVSGTELNLQVRGNNEVSRWRKKKLFICLLWWKIVVRNGGCRHATQTYTQCVAVFLQRRIVARQDGEGADLPPDVENHWFPSAGRGTTGWSWVPSLHSRAALSSFNSGMYDGYQLYNLKTTITQKIWRHG